MELELHVSLKFWVSHEIAPLSCGPGAHLLTLCIPRPDLGEGDAYHMDTGPVPFLSILGLQHPKSILGRDDTQMYSATQLQG